MSMMRPDISLSSLEITNLLNYLNLNGWESSESNQRWYVFQNKVVNGDSAMEIVLPRRFDAPDTPTFIASAMDVLSAIEDEPIERTLWRIFYVNSDVLLIKNTETGELSSISLKLADQQIKNIKQLVRFSTSFEKEPKPYFNTPLSSSNRMLKHYQFGHTFHGSFGLTIESPITGNPYRYQQETQSSTLFDISEYMDVESIVMPLERRVMERIARGLKLTRESTQARSTERLIQEYASGFNSNMCSAIIGISNEGVTPIEYSVIWSPRLAPADDIDNFGTVRLNETSYTLLREAAEILRTIKPEVRQIRGRVIELSSEGDPLGDGNTTRSVVIRWHNRETGERPVKIFVSLSRDEYVRAHQAHLNWSTVEVEGVVQKTGTIWRLLEPSNFEVVN